MRELVELEELYLLILEVVEKGGEFHFFPRGTSMEPLLYAGRDSVIVGAPTDIEVGDVLFYRRDDGAFVMHRLIEERDGAYTMCGDHQMMLEYGVRKEQVFAKMTGYFKGEEKHSTDEPEYIAYSKKMTSRFPFYRRNPKIYAFLKKVKKLIKRS